MSWQRVREHFDVLVALAEPARAARLQEIAATDRTLADQLRSLLASDAGAGGFLERPPPPASTEAPQPALAMGRRLGRFELVKPLGSGGMASVWEARQHVPERRVAIKLVARGERSDVERWRFQHEVQVLAGLNHPSIATFFEAGSDDVDGTEIAWFAMELVEGATDVLTWARGRGLDREQRLQLFLRLCDAVEYGHRRGVLHRDLKPGNVLVGSDGLLKLIDFGIAKALAGAGDVAGHTLTSHVVGTLQYMSPEQLAGRADAIGTASDVYALGTMLYQLLCDRPPYAFDGVPVARIPALVLETEPFAPSRARPDLPAELGWIVLRALEKDTARRYQTVTEFVDDLVRFRSHLPVRAGPPSTSYRLRKFVRRNRVAVAIAAALSIGAGVGAWGLWSGAEAARAQAAAAMRANGMSREVLRVISGLFDGIEDTEASRDLMVHELLASTQLDERATREPLVEQAVRTVRGRTLARLGRYTEARAELERAYELQQGSRGDEAIAGEDTLLQEDRDVLAAELGRVLLRAGDRARGEAMLRGAVAATASGASDAGRARIVGIWCRWLCDENAFSDLLTAATELRDVAARSQNATAAMVAQQRIAQAAMGLGRHEQAIAASERAWQLARERVGDRHRVTCSMLSVHVASLQLAGKLDEAEALYVDLIAVTRQIFGERHPNLLKTLNNHVHLLCSRGRMQEAIDSLQQIVAVYEARGGKMTQDHVTAIHNLGQVLSLSGRFAEAEPHLRRAAELSRTAYRPDDPDGIKMRFNLGACLASQKRWSEAEPALLAEYERLQAVLPAGHEEVAKARHTIADAYRANGFPEAAATWHAK